MASHHQQQTHPWLDVAGLRVPPASFDAKRWLALALEGAMKQQQQQQQHADPLGTPTSAVSSGPASATTAAPVTAAGGVGKPSFGTAAATNQTPAEAAAAAVYFGLQVQAQEASVALDHAASLVLERAPRAEKEVARSAGEAERLAELLDAQVRTARATTEGQRAALDEATGRIRALQATKQRLTRCRDVLREAQTLASRVTALEGRVNRFFRGGAEEGAPAGGPSSAPGSSRDDTLGSPAARGALSPPQRDTFDSIATEVAVLRGAIASLHAVDPSFGAPAAARVAELEKRLHGELERDALEALQGPTTAGAAGLSDRQVHRARVTLHSLFKLGRLPQVMLKHAEATASKRISALATEWHAPPLGASSSAASSATPGAASTTARLRKAMRSLVKHMASDSEHFARLFGMPSAAMIDEAVAAATAAAHVGSPVPASAVAAAGAVAVGGGPVSPPPATAASRPRADGGIASATQAVAEQHLATVIAVFDHEAAIEEMERGGGRTTTAASSSPARDMFASPSRTLDLGRAPADGAHVVDAVSTVAFFSASWQHAQQVVLRIAVRVAEAVGAEFDAPIGRLAQSIAAAAAGGPSSAKAGSIAADIAAGSSKAQCQELVDALTGGAAVISEVKTLDQWAAAVTAALQAHLGPDGSQSNPAKALAAKPPGAAAPSSASPLLAATMEAVSGAVLRPFAPLVAQFATADAILLRTALGANVDFASFTSPASTATPAAVAGAMHALHSAAVECASRAAAVAPFFAATASAFGASGGDRATAMAKPLASGIAAAINAVASASVDRAGQKAQVRTLLEFVAAVRPLRDAATGVAYATRHAMTHPSAVQGSKEHRQSHSHGQRRPSTTATTQVAPAPPAGVDAFVARVEANLATLTQLDATAADAVVAALLAPMAVHCTRYAAAMNQWAALGRTPNAPASTAAPIPPITQQQLSAAGVDLLTAGTLPHEAMRELGDAAMELPMLLDSVGVDDDARCRWTSAAAAGTTRLVVEKAFAPLQAPGGAMDAAGGNTADPLRARAAEAWRSQLRTDVEYVETVLSAMDSALDTTALTAVVGKLVTSA